MTHTPGPWTVDCTHPEWERNVVWAGDSVIAYAVDDQHDNADANAHLIAAAPELLAALKLLRNPGGDGKWPCYCDDPHYCGEKCENCIATAAINKAEGRGE